MQSAKNKTSGFTCYFLLNRNVAHRRELKSAKGWSIHSEWVKKKRQQSLYEDVSKPLNFLRVDGFYVFYVLPVLS
jgi:hypothetical protein